MFPQLAKLSPSGRRLVYITGHDGGARRMAVAVERSRSRVIVRKAKTVNGLKGMQTLEDFVTQSGERNIIPVLVDPERLVDAGLVDRHAVLKIRMLDCDRAEVTEASGKTSHYHLQE